MGSVIDYSLPENTVAEKVIGLCIEVHRELGPGLLESIYEETIAFELNQAGINFSRQKEIPVSYKGNPLSMGFRADLIVDNLIVLEVKSVELLTPVHAKQVATYLNLTQLRLGLLINFNEYLLRDGLRRIVNNLK